VNIIDANRKHIEAALDHGGNTHTFEDIKKMILEGRLQIWPGKKGCAVTEIITYPRKKVLHVFLYGGELDEAVDMIDSAEAWGRAQGCSGLTLSGRMGWQRALAEHGFKPVLITLERAFLPCNAN
jgi:hypothetical protein